jgi:DNA-directed RNA polymerase specialized sigma24 family protein
VHAGTLQVRHGVVDGAGGLRYYPGCRKRGDALPTQPVMPRVMPDDLRQLLEEMRTMASAPTPGALLAWLPRLRAMARRHLPANSPLRAGFDSEDLLQEGLLQLVRTVEQFRGSTWGEFLAFVHSILAQKKGQQVRRHQVRQREFAPEASSDLLAATLPTPSVDAIAGEDRRRVRELVEALADNDVLAQQLGIGPEALRQRLSRAVRMLQERW